MTLKQVVLPAPLGPIRPRISPSLMSKLTSSSATTPPNRSVTSSTSRTVAGGASRTQRHPRACVPSSSAWSFLPRARAPSARPDRAPGREQTLRPEDGQQHQRQAEDQHPAVLEPAEPLGEVGDQDGAEHHAPAVARAADHDRGEEQDRQQQREASGLMKPLLAGEQGAGEAADEGAHGEGEQLELEGRHAHQLGGVLVLARRLPGPAHPAVLDQRCRRRARSTMTT